MKIFNQKYCNVGMTQQQSLAKKGQEIRCRSGKNDLDKKSKRNDKHTAIPTSVAAFLFTGTSMFACLGNRDSKLDGQPRPLYPPVLIYATSLILAATDVGIAVCLSFLFDFLYRPFLPLLLDHVRVYIYYIYNIHSYVCVHHNA